MAINVFSAVLFDPHNHVARVWSCVVVPEGTVIFVPFCHRSIRRLVRTLLAAGRLSPHSKTANTIDLSLSISLSLIVSLSLAKSPWKSYRGNSQQKINICLVNSLTSIKDTVVSRWKAWWELFMLLRRQWQLCRWSENALRCSACHSSKEHRRGSITSQLFTEVTAHLFHTDVRVLITAPAAANPL